MQPMNTRTLGDIERARWFVPGRRNYGLIVRVEELEELFPEDDSYRVVCSFVDCRDFGLKYVLFGRESKADRIFDQRVAYQCDECDNVFVGPPNIIDFDSFDATGSYKRKGYDLYCLDCCSHLNRIFESF